MEMQCACVCFAARLVVERRCRSVGSAASGPSFVRFFAALRRCLPGGTKRENKLAVVQQYSSSTRAIGDLYPWLLADFASFGRRGKKIIVTHFLRHAIAGCGGSVLFTTPARVLVGGVWSFFFFLMRKVA